MVKSHDIATKSSSRNAWRTGLAVTAALLLGACTAGGDLGSLYAVAKQSFGGGSRKVTLAEAASVPYASVGLRLGNSTEIMLVLATDTGSQQLWTSASHLAVVTHNGRIVRTAGFGHDLGGYEGRTPDDIITPHSRWQADFPELSLYAIPIACERKQVGEETIEILGKDLRTRRINENCISENDRLDWSFQNTYWVDPDNPFVWRSVQHVNPKLDPIQLQILRPPA